VLCASASGRLLYWSQAVGRIEFIWFMNRTAAVELAVRGGVTRRVDRYSWKRKHTYKGIMRAPKGIARSNARLRHWVP
jgi:hypothetical protein